MLQVAAMPIGRAGKVKAICKPRPASVPSFQEIDRRRRENLISAAALIAAARTHPKTWGSAKRGLPVRDETLQRYAAALDHLIATGEAQRPRSLIAAFVRAAEVLLIAEIGDNQDLIAACSYGRNRRRRGAAVIYAPRIRSLALYLTAVELEIGNADLARAGFGTRQNVKQIRDDIEDLRADPAVDALLDRCAAKVRGEAL